MAKVFIINVGVNASHGSLRSPIFEDYRFEFVPIPEGGRPRNCPECAYLPRYSDLRSFNGLDLLEFIPHRYHTVRVHNDPEFTTFTYGDYPTISPRAANLKHASKGDHIFFLARLVKWIDGSFTKEGGFFLIGYIEIENILKEATERPEQAVLDTVVYNAHVRRAIYDPKMWNRFWVFKGSSDSCRFRCAVPFSREYADLVLRDSAGNRLHWNKNRTDLQVIGSHTRACRVIEKKTDLETFWSYLR